jgi:S-adenosylhomocysteine hydrolase/8-oxo-dGTP pyrophosphatase MutT (NUDIX family)
MQPLKPMIAQYLARFPQEETRLSQLVDLMEHATEKQLVNSEYYVGHITISAFVLSPSRHEVLLIQNKRHKMRLQPGGQVKSSDTTPIQAAMRIISNKTGLNEIQPLKWHYETDIPFDIDTHAITASVKFNEPRHWHHDLRYVFLSASSDLSGQSAIENDAQWVPLEELARYRTFERALGKLAMFSETSYAIQSFYTELSSQIRIPEKIDTIVVSHFLPDTIHYLRALERLTNVTALIPKPRSIVPQVETLLASEFNVIHIERSSGKEKLSNLLEQIHNPTILMDIGGYFADLPALSSDRCPNALIGIIEDTENGHRRYLARTDIRVPVVSVARSPLKDNEDFLVGQSVVFSADAILRDNGYLFQYMRIGVLGFGKIGRSIVQHTLQRNARVMLYDIDPVRTVSAYNLGADTPNRSTFLKQAEVIFSATGNHSLSILDFRSLKNGCFIFSITSSDDEIDLTFLYAEYSKEEIAPNVVKFSSFHNFFYLVNGGNAVNFLHKAVLGDFIQIVRGEMLFSLQTLTKTTLPPGLHQNDDITRAAVASIWLDKYVGTKFD